MRLVLLGDPVGHSLSPVIHRAGLRAAGLDGTYEARTVDEAGIRVAFDQLRYGTLDGANVTMPHKQLAFDLSEGVDEHALRTGAVNTLVPANGAVTGYNTDVAGVGYGFEHARLPDSAPVLVLGAGGAAAAALVALVDRDLFLSSRRSEAAADLLRRTRVEAEIVEWGSPVHGAVVVNATPIGMRGEALPPDLIDESSGLFEMPYASGRTPAEVHAAQLGLPVATGTDMLLGQAFEAFELWTGRPAPRAAMAAALEVGSQGRR